MLVAIDAIASPSGMIKRQSIIGSSTNRGGHKAQQLHRNISGEPTAHRSRNTLTVRPSLILYSVAIGRSVMFEAVAIFLMIMSVGVFAAHALDALRS